jgi:hypothetical protein
MITGGLPDSDDVVRIEQRLQLFLASTDSRQHQSVRGFTPKAVIEQSAKENNRGKPKNKKEPAR